MADRDKVKPPVINGLPKPDAGVVVKSSPEIPEACKNTPQTEIPACVLELIELQQVCRDLAFHTTGPIMTSSGLFDVNKTLTYSEIYTGCYKRGVAEMKAPQR